MLDNFKMAKFMVKVNLNLQMVVFTKAIYIRERCMVMENLFLMIIQDILVNLEIIVYKEEEYMKLTIQFMVG